MKYSLFFFVLFVSFSAIAACGNKIDPTKVILFVDTNNSELEIATAEKAACARGEKFVSVPRDYPTTSRLLDAPAKAAMEDIRKSNAKLKSVIISGHDGGGQFSGSKGGFGSVQLQMLMKEYKDIDEVNSALLLGCYTGVQLEMMKWRGIFPKIRLIGGYDGSAPLGDRPQGHQYITELLSKESQLIQQTDQKRLQNFTNSNLRSLSGLNAAVFIQCDETLKDDGYYFNSKHRENGFAKMDTKRCFDDVVIDKLIEDFSKYYSGEVEPPKDTVNGETRSIYNRARSLEHCYEIRGKGVNATSAFNIVFYEAVKKNFVNFFKDDLEKVSAEVSRIDPNEIIKDGVKEILELNIAIEKAAADLKLFDNPELYRAKMTKDLELLSKQKIDLMNSSEFSKVKASMNSLGAINPALMVQFNQAEAEAYMKYTSLNYEENNLKRDISLSGDSFSEKLKNLKYISQMKLESQKTSLKQVQASHEQLKSTPQILKDIWIPNSSNMTSKTRKELLQNAHQINKVLTIPGLSKKQRTYLTWTNTVITQHLQSFQNPFSWHEFTGKSEAPQFPWSLSLIEQQSTYIGAMGGMGGMGGFGSLPAQSETGGFLINGTVGGRGSGN